MYLRFTLALLTLLSLYSCSDNSNVISDINKSFSNWQDSPESVKVFSDQVDAETNALPWQPKVSRGAIDTINFSFDSSSISPEDIAKIKEHAKLLVSKNYIVRILGHSDERGSREYNISLGWKRARSVALYFEQFGVPADKIMIVSYGKEKPRAYGHKPSTWAKNRRVEIFYQES